jgi:hypothetical protein
MWRYYQPSDPRPVKVLRGLVLGAGALLFGGVLVAAVHTLFGWP